MLKIYGRDSTARANQWHSARATVTRAAKFAAAARATKHGNVSASPISAPLPQTLPPALPLHERYAIGFARAVLSRPYIFSIVFWPQIFSSSC